MRFKWEFVFPVDFGPIFSFTAGASDSWENSKFLVSFESLEVAATRLGLRRLD